MARKSTSMSNDALLTYAEAAAFVAKRAARLARTKPATERVTLAASAGRVLAETLRADADQPPFARSTRDGFACRAAEASAHRPLAIAGATRAGDPPSGPLPHGAVWEIMTGAPVPRGADAVIMLEHVELAHVETDGSDTAPTIRLSPPRTVKPGENIVLRGAQARKGAALLPAGTLIGPAQIALAASCGACQAQGLRPAPRGDSLHGRRAGADRRQTQARPDSQLELGAMLAAMVVAAGGCAMDLSHRPRHRQITRRRPRSRRHGRSSAHHRRRIRRQIRPGRARTRPHGSPLPLHRRAHAARQAAGVRRVPPPFQRAQPKPGPHEVLFPGACRAIPSRPPSPSCSSPRRSWPHLPAGAI